jgi:hypothetical protein
LIFFSYRETFGRESFLFRAFGTKKTIVQTFVPKSLLGIPIKAFSELLGAQKWAFPMTYVESQNELLKSFFGCNFWEFFYLKRVIFGRFVAYSWYSFYSVKV